ncbi:DUF4236 domain-containing protein [Chitinivibrio alkaliphilus]|uniref:DUF4236 domain-containing protein n=1 Tax=Chitinivibrio alkaliphilus ACht1 TaxID=1313304 RepID=U7D448_9BACT|nr:DUF4236 domain-containing protein [Chitinivibrio alkaliphilus]ERP30733.1 hypothetical protein CALK_2451 [Chitinivibrio alkaliphilus ACht1]
MRFRKRAELFPGVRLNFSKSGVSITGGVPGASINMGKKGTYLNTGIPGTGLYDRVRLDGKTAPSGTSQGHTRTNTSSIIQSHHALHTEDIAETSSTDLQELNTALFACKELRSILVQEYRETKRHLRNITLLHRFLKLFLVGFFLPPVSKKKTTLSDTLRTQRKGIATTVVSIGFSPEKNIEEAYATLKQEYRRACTCHTIWDVTAEVRVDQQRLRSFSRTLLTKEHARCDTMAHPLIAAQHIPLHFATAHNHHLYLYPGFILIEGRDKKQGVVDLADTTVSFEEKILPEEGEVPPDATIIRTTWKRVNKDGSRDKRYRDNYEIPLCTYGFLTLESSTGLREAFLFSSYEKSSSFGKSLTRFIRYFTPTKKNDYN